MKPMVCDHCMETSTVEPDPSDPKRVIINEVHRMPCDGQSVLVLGQPTHEGQRIIIKYPQLRSTSAVPKP